MRTFETLIAEIARELDRAEIPYMVIGGQAVLLYAEPRLTKDIDITLGADVDAWDRVTEIARAVALDPIPQDIQQFVKETSVLPAVDSQSAIRVDFIFSFTPYERQAIERATIVNIDNALVRFASLEDAIIHKLFAGRPRDIEDVRSMLSKNELRDIEYIQRWLNEFSGVVGRNLVREYENIEAETRS